MHRVTFEGNDLQIKSTLYRRVGKPRHEWHQENMKEAWQQIDKKKTNQEEYIGSVTQRKIIQQEALDRRAPFEQTKNEKLHKDK